ncbi:ABC-type oligopeptide transport system periplasmic component [Rubrobacter radiotolerans]|uniref:ABC-type oligopeptide transport system periplasmic component n=1 Tax=Rubrobacter radiotolerans TaxID=42256 RepID=A0A023X254_RUBRA|nr:peptide ABC transporter substrate-binding protein [Rubrobacter radiotolerans]AHY46050.1 ABC-type oligopeptide transport system periplasmic component [Rubrobacter radiotolerans]MDX5893460.1 peptide ABC transporter substrate-binding protein [Rubrobacter radiotolerans]SMC03776.1 oligopeptide transport system substrate-binding protein [Rubrobacter radiotolerans DSM 5868]
MTRARVPEDLFRSEKAKASGLSRRDFLKVGGVGLAGVSMLGMTGCGNVFGGGGGEGGGGNGGGGGGAGVLDWNSVADIPDMDPSTSTDAASGDLLNNIYDTLYALDEELVPQPSLAESYEESDDGLTYTFTLRDGIVWSNGDPVTAENFRYSWLRAMNPDTASQYSFIIADYVEGGQEFSAGEGSEEDVGIEAPDERTLVVNLSRPTPYFLSLTAFKTYLPLNQAFVEEQGDNFAQGPDSMIYCGPYVLTEFNPTNGARLEKNPDYWDADNVTIETVNVEIINDQNTALNLYESDGLDLVELSGENAQRIEDNPERFEYTEFASWYLTYNYEDEAMANENIRRAISQGVDKQALTDQILRSGAVPATGLVPLEMAGVTPEEPFRDLAGDAALEFNADEARQAWEAGVEELGSAPTLRLLSQDSTAARDLATFLQSQLRENLGAEVEIDVQPFESFLDRIEQLDYQFVNQGWIADYNDPSSFLDLFLSDSPFNRSGYSNERYDELVLGTRETNDNQARMDAFVEAERILLQEDVAIGVLYFDGRTGLVKPNVEPAFPPFGGVHFKDWTLDEQA